MRIAAVAMFVIAAIALLHIAALLTQERLAPLRGAIVLWWQRHLTWDALMWWVREADFYLKRGDR